MQPALGIGYAAQVGPIRILDEKRVQDGVGRVLLDLVLQDGLAIAGHGAGEGAGCVHASAERSWLSLFAGLWPQVGTLHWLEGRKARASGDQAGADSGGAQRLLDLLNGFDDADESSSVVELALPLRSVGADSMDQSDLQAQVVPQFADAAPHAISIPAFRALRTRAESAGIPLLLWRDLHGLLEDQDALRPLADGILCAFRDSDNQAFAALLLREGLAGASGAGGDFGPPSWKALAPLWAAAESSARERLLDAAYYLEAGLQNIASSIGVAVDVVRRGARIRLKQRPPQVGEVPADTQRFCLRMAEEGVAVGPPDAPALCLSTVHDAADLDFVLDSARNSWRA